MPARIEIDAEGNEREALLLRLADKLGDLFLMEEQFACPEGLVVHDVPVAVGIDVAVVQEHLSVVHAGIAVPQIHEAVTEGFDLRSAQKNPGFEPVLDVIVVERLPVGSDDFLAFIFVLRHDVPL